MLIHSLWLSPLDYFALILVCFRTMEWISSIKLSSNDVIVSEKMQFWVLENEREFFWLIGFIPNLCESSWIIANDPYSDYLTSPISDDYWQKLVMIDKNPSSMHREYYEFYAVHVYLRSICISLVSTSIIFLVAVATCLEIQNA